MRGQRPILEACIRAAGRGEPSVLATVVRVAGSAYRRPGARMLFPQTGPPAGFISGGCLEGDLAERAAEVAAGGGARTVVYDMRSPDDIVWGLGLGCNGEVRVLLERIDPASPPPWIAATLDRLERRERVVLASVFAGPAEHVGRRRVRGAGGDLQPGALRDALDRRLDEADAAGRGRVVEIAGAAALIEVIEPPVALLVCGAGSDALPLARQAAALDWEVHVVDRREGHARPDRFAGATSVRRVDYRRLGDQVSIDRRTPVVVMTHHFLDDLELLQQLAVSDTPYIGLIGPRARRGHLLRELRARGVSLDAGFEARLFGPVGLDIGSETAEEIALAVVAEIRAVLGGRGGGFLRERPGPLHEPFE